MATTAQPKTPVLMLIILFALALDRQLPDLSTLLSVDCVPEVYSVTMNRPRYVQSVGN